MIGESPKAWQAEIEPGVNLQEEKANMDKVITGLLVLVGIIHLLPLSGVLGVDRLWALYGCLTRVSKCFKSFGILWLTVSLIRLK